MWTTELTFVFKIFSEDFVTIEMDRLNVIYDKPIIYDGSVLEISKFISMTSFAIFENKVLK